MCVYGIRRVQDADRNWPRGRKRGRGKGSHLADPNVGESEKKRDARRERWGRVCGRDWPWHTRSRYAYISPRGCHKTFHGIRLPRWSHYQRSSSTPAEQTNLAATVTIKIIIGPRDRRPISRVQQVYMRLRLVTKKKLSPLRYHGYR